MKVITTKYNGYKFRSRTEARWAVFLDEIYVKYEYEKEGFVLDHGLTYLPDFFLPELDIWLEIKPSTMSYKDYCKCRSLAAHTKKMVMILMGQPDPETLIIEIINPDGSRIGPDNINRLYNILNSDAAYTRPRLNEILVNFIGPSDYGDGNEHAYIAARSARFEFGGLI